MRTSLRFGFGSVARSVGAAAVPFFVQHVLLQIDIPFLNDFSLRCLQSSLKISRLFPKCPLDYFDLITPLEIPEIINL